MLSLAAMSRADVVILKNGDRITGTVETADGGKLKIMTDAFGEVTVDLSAVQTFTTDKPAQFRMKDKSIVRDTVSSPTTLPAAPTTQGTSAIVVGGKTVPLDQIKRMNVASQWTGGLLLNGNLARGNSDAENLGIAFNAALRRDDENYDDRFSLAGAYNFGKSDVNGVETTSSDNWFAQAKYDKYFDDKWYGYGLFRYDHDRLAFLNFRLSPGVGVGYQWVESPNFNFSTEAGISYVYEDYSNDGNDDRVALRLAYHIDKQLNATVSVFNDLEWLPAIDDPSDYNLNIVAGIKAQMTAKMYSLFSIVFQRDSTPAPGAEKNDTRLVLGIGWNF